ncbi:putative domain SAYSvFN [Arabidopsis thaliana x Arabidopsis arenosa]|uniref:Putative domain SAYSvFN n=1 Tax=Arabidopsis thaliana x Arabidopsis arenosa TaxID=1240361 RepID=A0A8T2A6P8_9BRAS|nr:putative domain SAYSvFN [Arabidopsis thaliana x Arabidopsis arenosa]
MVNSIEEASSDSTNNGTIEITYKTIGPARPSQIRVASHIKVRDLRNAIAEMGKFPVSNLRMILRGKALQDEEDGDDLYVTLKDQDSLIVAVIPNPPAGAETFDDDDDDDLKFKLPPSANRWKRKFYYFLRNKLKLPDIILMGLFSLSLKMWVIITLWFILAPIAHQWDLGPIFILGTGFSIILLNLGKRQPGDVSAYSIFNEDFRELPGTYNADRIDRDILAGQI